MLSIRKIVLLACTLAGICAPASGILRCDVPGNDAGALTPLSSSTGGYLAISAPGFAASTGLQSLLALRCSEGFDVILVDTDTTGKTAQEIRSYIQNAFNTWPVPPAHLLLVGDTDAIPHWIGSSTLSPPTDLYYACVDGDELPDIMYGRLPVRTVYELDSACAKIVAMDGSVCKEAAFLAGEGGWQQSEASHDAVIDSFLDPAGWTTIDRLYCHTHGATTGQVSSSFNDGRSIGCFAGLGSVDAWMDGPAFAKADVLALTNTVHPFILSFAPLTGDFSAAECFGETWLRGPRGASAFFGASSRPFSGSTALLEWCIFEGWQNSGHDRIGGMIAYAFYRIEAAAGPSPDDKRSLFEMYNLLGDPAMRIIGAGPSADIKINGEDGPLSIPSQQAASLAVSLDPGVQAGVPHDWWIGALRNGSSLYCWTQPGGWTFCTVPVRAHSGPLIALTDHLVSQGRIPVGSWRFVFAVDALNNIFEGTIRDTIIVTSF